jgi:hypothetical protein
MVTPVGVLPSTTEDEPDDLVTCNNMLSSWSEQRRRVNNMTVEFLAGIAVQITNAAKISITGSPAQSALESTLAAALAGVSVTPLTALATYATVTTDNTYATGMDWAIQTNLAIKLASKYKRPVPPELAEAAALALSYVMPDLTKAA